MSLAVVSWDVGIHPWMSMIIDKQTYFGECYLFDNNETIVIALNVGRSLLWGTDCRNKNQWIA